MSSFIANQVKGNMCLILLKNSFLFALTYVYNNNYNYNSLFDTTIRYSAYNLFVSANLYS